AQLLGGNRAIEAVAVDEDGRSSIHTQRFFTVLGRSHYRRTVLRLHAGVEFAAIEVVFLPIVESGVVKRAELLGKRAVRALDRALVSMNVVGKIPIGIVVLIGKAVGIHCSVNGPGMNVVERKIFVDDADLVFVVWKDFVHQGLITTGAVRALEVVIDDHRNLGVFGPQA